MKTIELLVKEYHECLEKQSFITKDLDYSILEKYKPILKQLSLLDNSGITVFDLSQKEHIYASYNFNNLFGHNLSESKKSGSEYFNSKIHPEDFTLLIQTYIKFTEFLFSISKEERINHKLISNYRILTTSDKYVSVTEQYQEMEPDKNKNVWLALSVIDLSPIQNNQLEIQSQILNFKTGDFFNLIDEKNKTLVREITKNTFLKKETYSLLSDTLGKVNLQRRKMLEKLNIDNPMEAIKRVAKLGLVD